PALPNQTTFSNLVPGIYSFTEATVPGWSLAGIECSSGVEYKTDQATGTVSLALTANSNVSCTFFNEQRLNDTSQICGIKFNDLNGNGRQDIGELGLPGWQITAVSAKPILIESTTTNIKGEYCFTNLPAGNYQLVESPQAPWQQTFPANGNPHLVTLATGQKVTGINFGNALPSGSCSAATQGTGPGTLANGNFEAEQFTLNTPFSFENESLVTGWETTQADGLIEFWSSGYQNVPAYNGNQFIEVNAHTGATIMQNFTATPGSTVTISFAHRGRRGFPNQMQVAIGPMGGLPVTLGTYTGDLSNWTVHTVSYTFPNNGLTSYVIGFTAMDTTAGGNFLDAISMIDTACETLGPPTDVSP
ncbi:MAG: SdrD B-like domain-containing protein, partial [Pseudohongiella sp.]|nr:SdrD B-like domain-containing protein [Pseudohongiella sp.]